MIHVYPDQFRTILLYIEALDDIDKKILERKPDFPVWPKAIHLTDESGSDWGTLQDEIGGAWSWMPPSPVNTGGQE